MSLRFFARAAAFGVPLFLLAACDSPPPPADDGASICLGHAPPAASPGLTMQLSVVDFGEPARSGGWRSRGFNLDGLCSSRTSVLACRSTGTGVREDGDDGIDNAFGKQIVDLFGAVTPTPSVSWSGGSFLQLDDAGNGTLVLASAEASFRIPLRSARIEGFDGAGGMLGAIVPLEELLAAVTDGLAAISTDLCQAAARDGVRELVRSSADVLAGGGYAPDRACDGISLGMRFVGVPATALPPPRPDLCTGAEAQVDAGVVAP
jgi:hypothetical protein